MPTDILMTDVRFPSEASLKGKKTDEKIGVITNYLYMLKEQLAYNMYHIGSSQLLPSVTDDITAPIFKHLEDQDGNITELQVTANGLSASVSDINENIAKLQLTADAFATMVSDGEGNQSTLTQLAEAFVLRVSNAEGDASEALQTVEGLTLKSTVSGNTATLGLYNGNVLYGNAAQIVFSGFVTFTDLSSSGNTTINGNNITTGTISGDRLNVTKLNATSGTIALWSVSENTIYSGNVGMYSGSTYKKDSLVTSGTSAVRFFAGGAYQNGKFVVLEDGSLYASSAELTGSITVKEGEYVVDDTTIGRLYGWTSEWDTAMNVDTYSGYGIRLHSGGHIFIYTKYAGSNIYIGQPSVFGTSSTTNRTIYFYGDVNFSNANVIGI